jgi:hypothetical protein
MQWLRTRTECNLLHRAAASCGNRCSVIESAQRRMGVETAMLDYDTVRIIWWLILGVLLIGFAIMDGSDLGVGTISRFIGRTDEERRALLASIVPVWGGNQVWVLLGGGAVFGAWPQPYADPSRGCTWPCCCYWRTSYCGRSALVTATSCAIRAGATYWIGRCSRGAPSRRSCSESRSAICFSACRSISMRCIARSMRSSRECCSG